MIKKQEIRRAVRGTCVVVSAAVDVTSVTVNVQRRHGCWPRLATKWRKVAAFDFLDTTLDTYRFVHGLLDLEYLYNIKAHPGDVQVKVCVEHSGGKRQVARISLEDFLGQLLIRGRLEWFFLYLDADKVTLCPAGHELSMGVPDWPYEPDPRGSHPRENDNEDCRTEKNMMNNYELIETKEEPEEKEEETKLEEDEKKSDDVVEEMTEDKEKRKEVEDIEEESGWETVEEEEVLGGMTEDEEEGEKLKVIEEESEWETVEEEEVVGDMAEDELERENLEVSEEENGLDTDVVEEITQDKEEREEVEDIGEESEWETDEEEVLLGEMEEDEEEKEKHEVSEEGRELETEDLWMEMNEYIEQMEELQDTEYDSGWESDEDTEEEIEESGKIIVKDEEQEIPVRRNKNWQKRREPKVEMGGRGNLLASVEKMCGHALLAALTASTLVLMMFFVQFLVPAMDYEERHWGGGDEL